MRLIFLDESWEDCLYWQKTDSKVLNKIIMLIKDIARISHAGSGKPEPLRFKFQEYWSRRINHEPRLIYKAVGDEIWIAK
jgi:toxin YoeB